MEALDAGGAGLVPPFDFTGRVIAVTVGTGVLGRQLVAALAQATANLALVVRDVEKARTHFPPTAIPAIRLFILPGDVTDRASLGLARDSILGRFSRVDGLVNGVGDNRAEASTRPKHNFFYLTETALQSVLDLNLMETILPTQVFAELMAKQSEGVVLNIASMNAIRPLTRTPACSAAKAGVANFTQWLAVHLAQEYSPRIRVTAIATGFFLTEKYRFLLLDPASGDFSARGRAILSHTPMRRFGNPGNLVGTLLWLLSTSSAFVTGAIIPTDGGFSAFGGV